MWNDAESIIEPELVEGERILWSGQPKQGIRFRAFDIAMIPFSIVWGGFAFAWETIAIVMEAPLLFKLFGIPFVIIGFQIMIGRFFTDARRRKQTFYGVTDSRIIIVSGTKERSVSTLIIREIAEMKLREKSDGSGSIVFDSDSDSDSRITTPATRISATGWMPGVKDGLPELEMIENAREVHGTIESVRNGTLETFR